MDEKLITRKQFSAAILVSLLSPLLRLLPQTAVTLAGKGAWLSPLAALVPVLLLAWLLESFRRHMRPGEGMAGLLLRWLGPAAGRAVLALYAAWFLFYGGFILRSGAERLVSTIYPSSGQGLFVAVTIALCLVVTLGELRAAARTSVILRAVLIGALAVVTVFSVSNMDASRLAPFVWQDAAASVAGSLPLVSVCGVAACFSFLSGYVQAPGNGRWLWGTHLLLLALGGVICAAVMSVFGPALTARLTYPFFIMIRSISLGNLVPRVEAVVIAVWVAADFMLVVMLLRCAHEALRTIFGLPDPERSSMGSLRGGRFLLWLEAGAVFGCSFLFDLPPWQLKLWSDRYIPLCSDIVLYGGFTLLWLITLPRRKKEKSRG